MPPKRNLPPRGSQVAQSSKPPLSDKAVSAAQPLAKSTTRSSGTSSTTVATAPPPLVPSDSPFAKHLDHAKKLYKDKVSMIIKVQKKRIDAAKRLKRLQMANIQAQYDFEMTQATTQGEKAVELLNKALSEYATNTAGALPPSTPYDINGNLFSADSNPFQLTAAGQIPNTGVLSSRHHKILMQAQAQAAAAAAAANGASGGGGRSRVTRGSKADKDNLSDYASDTGITPIPEPAAVMAGRHTHLTCAAAYLTTCSNVMKRYQQLLLETGAAKDGKDGKSSGGGKNGDSGNGGGSRKRSSDKAGAGQSSSMYISSSIPHFFNQTITQRKCALTCNSFVLTGENYWHFSTISLY